MGVHIMPLGNFFLHIEDDEDQDDDDKERKRKQTEKARTAALVSRVRRKTVQPELGSEQSQHQLEDSRAREIQKRFFTRRLRYSFALSRAYEATAPDPKKAIMRDRARCAWSLLCCLAKSLENIFAVDGGTRIKHAINTVVPDDTTTRFKGPNPGDRTLVHTIMNSVQCCIVTYETTGAKANANWHCLAMPCPSTIIRAPDAQNIHEGYSSFLVCGANGVGKALQRLGVPVNLATDHGAQWQVQVMCGDALEANSSAFHSERKLLFHNRRTKGECHNKIAFRLQCCNHQLNLIRKPIVLGIERYWATLVRLAHLFECAAFRRRFAAGLVTLLSVNGAFERDFAEVLVRLVLTQFGGTMTMTNQSIKSNHIICYKLQVGVI